MLAKIDLVGVKDENLLLGQPVLDDHGEEDFCQFPADGAARCQKEVSRELHGQCAATLKPLVRAEIGEGGGHHAESIHAVVGVKPMVFGGENGVHQRLGEVLVTNQMALRAAGAKEGCHRLGLKPVGLQVGHIVEIRNRREAITLEFQAGWTFDHLTVSEERLGARSDFQSRDRESKAADAADILTLAVAGLSEEYRDTAGICPLSTMQLAWGSQDYRRIAENVPIQAGINDSRELQVKVNKNTRDSRDSKEHQ